MHVQVLYCCADSKKRTRRLNSDQSICPSFARSAWTGLIEDQPEDEYERTMRVNYLGSVFAVRAALPHMSAGGRIVLIGSMAGLTGVAGYSSYCPTKFAVRGLAEALTMELRPRGITVSLATPPDVDTPGFAHEVCHLFVVQIDGLISCVVLSCLCCCRIQ
jgi:NAD(P)-dependent dehydrogenase (short-subunit alcohol dehydrogenase family)